MVVSYQLTWDVFGTILSDLQKNVLKGILESTRTPFFSSLHWKLIILFGWDFGEELCTANLGTRKSTFFSVENRITSYLKIVFYVFLFYFCVVLYIFLNFFSGKPKGLMFINFILIIYLWLCHLFWIMHPTR